VALSAQTPKYFSLLVKYFRIGFIFAFTFSKKCPYKSFLPSITTTARGSSPAGFVNYRNSPALFPQFFYHLFLKSP